MDSGTLSQPGVYRSAVSVRESTPYAAPSVDVMLTAQAPASWAQLSGTVIGRTCDGDTVPLAGATVAIDRRANSWTLATANDGGYALWLPGGGPKARVVVATHDYRPASVDVALRQGSDTRLPFTLERLYC